MATNYAVAPGEFLQEWIEEEGHGVTQAELAQQLGVSRKLVNELLRGKAPITPETALKLERVTNIPGSTWLLYESQYRGDLARLKDQRQLEKHTDMVTTELASYLRKIGVSASTIRDKKQVLADLLSFTRFGSCEALFTGCAVELNSSLATSRESGSPVDDALMMAWLAAGELSDAYEEAFSLTFNRKMLEKILPQIKQRALSIDNDTITDIAELLKTAGVVYQFVEPPTKFPLYGITRWLRNGVPLIQQTGRRKKNCYVIWTLFHELGHILCDEKRTTHLDFTKPPSKKPLGEKAANQFARDQLFGGSVQDYRGMTHARDIESKALREGHVPCSVIMELHRTHALDRSWGNQLIVDVPIPFVGESS